MKKYFVLLTLLTSSTLTSLPAWCSRGVNHDVLGTEFTEIKSNTTKAALIGYAKSDYAKKGGQGELDDRLENIKNYFVNIAHFMELSQSTDDTDNTVDHDPESAYFKLLTLNLDENTVSPDHDFLEADTNRIIHPLTIAVAETMGVTLPTYSMGPELDAQVKKAAELVYKSHHKLLDEFDVVTVDDAAGFVEPSFWGYLADATVRALGHGATMPGDEVGSAIKED